MDMKYQTPSFAPRANKINPSVKRCYAITVIACLSAVFLTGCLPKLSTSDLGQLRPQRPAELDRLEMLLGDWETTGEIRMTVADDVIHTRGHNHAEWSLDRRMFVEHAQLDMGAMGPMSGMSIWTYDEGAKKYRMWWFDSFGETSEAVVKFDEKTSTWHMKATGQKYGYSTSGSGTIRRIDADTLEWTWVERGFKLLKLAEMKGTSRRVGPGKP